MATKRNRRLRRRTRRGMGGGAKFSIVFEDGPISPRMTMEATEHAPTITWDAPLPEEYRTFLCFDPDATAKSWIHWLVVNCTGTSPTSGDELVPWAPPTPPSGAHRYIFVLFSHMYPIHMAPPERGLFNISEFVTKWGLNQIAVTQMIVSSQEAAGKKKEPSTIVTAYFEISSRHTPERYMEWAANILKLEAPIVLFTSPTYRDKFLEMRGNLPIKIYTMELSDTYMWKTYEAVWKEHHTLDPEASYHSPELYAIWANKAIWLQQIASENPFSSDYFVWCDLAAFRNSANMDTFIKPFPNAVKNFTAGKMLFSVVSHFKFDDFVVTNEIPGNFTAVDGDFKDRVVGIVWGGDKDACNKWSIAYEEMLKKYLNAGLFAGKDQSVMMSTILNDPTLCEMVEPTMNFTDHPADVWFFLEYLLSDPKIVKRVYDAFSTG